MNLGTFYFEFVVTQSSPEPQRLPNFQKAVEYPVSVLSQAFALSLSKR
jgi:hypothetical protein